MVCNQCKNQLREGVKFCGQCGNKTEPGKESSSSKSVSTGYSSKILAVIATGPDSDGDMSVEVRFSITNQSGSSWDQLITRTQLISDSGYIEETTDTHEQLVEDGETEEFEISFYAVKARPFMANPELTKTIINVVACSATSKKLTEFVLPETSFEVVKMEPCDISDSVRFLSGGIWRTDPDDDKDVRVEAKWLVQNLTDTHIPEVRFTAEVAGKSGAEIGDAGGYEELRPGVSVVISGSTYSKEKKLKGAVVQVGARVMSPAATGSSEHMGLELTASDEAVHDDESSQNGENNAGHFSGGQPNGEIARYVRTNEDGSLICAIAYFQEVVAAWPSDTTRILGAYWGYAGGGVGYDGGFFVINGESEPEVLDFEQANQSDESEKFNSLMAEVSKLYIGDSDAATLSEDGQALVDSGTSDGDDKVYWDSNFQGEALGKVSQQWGINWRFEFDDTDRPYSTANFEAAIKWGYCNDDVDTKLLPAAFNEAKKLWATKHQDNLEKAFELISPFIACVFLEGNADGELTELFAQNIDEIEANSVVVYGLDFSESNLPKVKASARFLHVSTNGVLDKDRLEEWQEENSFLDNCVSFEWRIDGLDDDLDLRSWNHSGLSLLLVEDEQRSEKVNCRYCVDLGKYIFATEEERDAFIKDPQFIFDFQPGNVDDKKGLIRIFGSTVNISPVYKDNAPKFIITHLEKNEANDLGVIVSVEVEMAFEIQVGVEEFRDWIDSSDSTWRYSGRIECVGEDGMEDSDREEYEFNW